MAICFFIDKIPKIALICIVVNPYNTIWHKKGCSKYLLTEIEAYAVGCIVNAHPQAQLTLSLGECINSAFHPAFLPPMVGVTLEDKFYFKTYFKYKTYLS
mgnify:CR=1 FL=1